MVMNDPKSQPGQRNIANQGDRNINASGDNPTFNFYNTPPERSAKHQLRAPVGDFVGRETEITELTAELTNGGQVGISGISGLGGIGKTELALVVANRLLPNYPDAQLMVELRGTDPTPRRAEDALADCILAFAGLEARLPDDRDTLVKLYRDCLTGKRVLVLLDNAADAEQVRPFLVPGGCALLVTSRETISLPKMKRIRLEQLPPDKARELLREIAPRVPPIDAIVADQICFLCGYLPLAVRAAASLLDVTPDLDPPEYAAELGDERRRLELKYANAEGHEISVEASFNLSYARLSPEAARVFRSLAVFPASFDAAAEDAICQDTRHKLLSDLVRRNLVIFDEAERRYRLHDLVRIFANSQLGKEEQTVLLLKYAQHFRSVLAKAESHFIKGHEQVQIGVMLFKREQANIETGMATVTKMVELNLQAAELCVEYPNTAYNLLDLLQHPRERIQWLEAQLAAARRLNRKVDEGYALGNLGIVHTDLGEFRKAIEFYEQRITIAYEIGDQRSLGSAMNNLGLAYSGLGETRKAIEFYKQALIIAREVSHKRNEGNSLGNLGNAFADLGDTKKAIEFYEQGLAIAREIGDRRGESSTLSSLGAAYIELDDIHKAIEYCNQALIICREIDYRSVEGHSLWYLALASDKLSEREKALACAETALKIFEEIESHYAAKVREQLAEWRRQE